MRILVVHWHATVIGGTEKYLRSTIRALVRRGHEVALLHGYEPDPASARIALPPDKQPSWCIETLGIREALRAVAAWSPSSVYVNSWQSPSVERVLLEEYPCALFVHDYHRTCPTGTKCQSFPDTRACSRQAGPACIGFHYPLRCGGLNPLTMLRDYRRQSDQLRFLPHYQAILVASRHMRAELVNHGVSSDRLRLAPLFPPEISPDATPPESRPIRGNLLLVSRLVNLKGADFLIKALSAAESKLGRRLHLTIAGNGPDEIRLRQLAASLAVDVQFEGWLDQSRIATLMRDSDLLVFPSVWPEPFGLAGIEAGCVGLPAVGFDVGGVSEWLKPGYSGELAPGDPPTVESLGDALVRALCDPDHHTDLRRGAWETAKQFSIAAHIDTLDNALEGIRHGHPVFN